MITKGIISFIVMLSTLFLLSCHGVNYNDKKSDSDNWYDDLSNEEIIDWMEITTTENGADSVTVSWECPINSTSWLIEYSETGALNNFNPLTTIVTESGTAIVPGYDITIYKTQISSDNYCYEFKHTPSDLTNKIMVYYKIIMKDVTNQIYANVVPYVVFPQNKTIKITVTDETESSALSDIYGSWDSTTPLFSHVNTNYIPPSVETNVSTSSPAYFWIESDFSFSGLSSKVLHKSNSSYCKVTIESTVPIKLKYSFEDYPKELLSYHPALFDYNDIVFIVEVIE